MLRTILIAAILSICTLVLKNCLDDDLVGPPTFKGLRVQLLEIAPWSAAAIGAIYIALYSRFASQWSYLASLYNQIKQVELEMFDSQSNDKFQKKLAEWKAGYIEDASELHLHTKRSVAGIIFHWGSEENVKNAFCSASPGGEERWEALYKAAEGAYQRATSSYKIKLRSHSDRYLERS